MLDDPNTVQTPAEPPRQDDATRRRQFGDQGLMQIFFTTLLVVVAFGAGWFGNSFVHQNTYVAPQTSDGKVNDEYLIKQAWDAIVSHYVVTSNIDTKKMAYDAIRAMVNDLGDTGHSRFETPQEFQQEQSSLNNEPTVGIGVYLSGGGTTPLRIESIIPGSPADKSQQLKPGDTITAVDGTSIQGKTLDQVRPMISGKADTKVTLTISRQNGGQTQTFDVTLTRGSFTAPVVTSYIIPGLNIADIQIAQFADNTDTELRKALQDANSKKVAGIILDLRGNPGGYLDQAIKVASEFIPAGANKNVLIEKTRTSSTTDAVQPGGLATSTPLTILVDGDTASAAEIVTGSIAVNRSEVHIVGQTTFGTGTVLNTFHLADGSALILGTEEFLLPNGKAIYHNGCKPDQAIALPQGATPISVLSAQEQNITADQIQQSQDTQLQRAIQNLTDAKDAGPTYQCAGAPTAK